MKTIIRITTSSGIRKFSTFTKACRTLGISYNYLKQFKLPKQYKQYFIERVKPEAVE